MNLNDLAQRIKAWGVELGFSQVGITTPHLEEHRDHLRTWLHNNHHGDMHYMQRHTDKRCYPQKLVPNTIRVISVRLDYFPPHAASIATVLANPQKAYISRYALGRDYHRLMRRRLQALATKIAKEIGPYGYRAFVDSAPVLERALAENAGLGWIGKHTNLIQRKAGSWFFLGEIFVDIPLPADVKATNHCGTCSACIRICPTQAIVAPYQLDARKCISYHTIELKGSIPVQFRKSIGNRIFGCDDCQLICPWNRFAKKAVLTDFAARHALDASDLVTLFEWDEAEFLQRTSGSAIRRLGYERWLRNLAVGLGNAPTIPTVVRALQKRLSFPSPLVQEHVVWALRQHHVA